MNVSSSIRTIATACVVALALLLSVAASPALAAGRDDDKPRPAGGPAADQSVLEREAAAQETVDPRLQRRLAGVNARIARHVERRGTQHTFGSYVDATTDTIVVETDAPSDVVSAVLGEERGSRRVVVRRQRIRDDWSRKSDIPSYWGGAGVTASVGTPWCSTGFTVQNAWGTRSQVTAGHCFNNGTNVYTENGGRWMGSVSGNGLLAANKHDMELIGGSGYWGYIFTGGVDSSTGIRIVGSGDPVEGYTDYCHSGRTTGEHCGHRVLSNFAQVCTQTGCKYPVTAWTGGTLIQGGDSGSPFYVKNSTGAWARGINIASGGSTAYAEKWSRIQARYGVSITTG